MNSIDTNVYSISNYHIKLDLLMLVHLGEQNTFIIV